MIRFSESRLREYLAFYGADIETWPDEARIIGRWAQKHHPEFAALIEAEKRLEDFLSSRRIAMSHAGLAERIVAAAQASSHIGRPASSWLADGLFDIKPASLAAMLALGIAIGFGTFMAAPLNKNYSMQASYADDEGAFL